VVIQMSDSFPNPVIIAKNAMNRLSSLTAGYGQVVCVTDAVLLEQYGRRIQSLVANRLIWMLSSDYRAGESHYPSDTIIVGFGGGRSLDTAKLIASETGLDWISVPTAASHDGIASEVASVSQDGYKYSMKCRCPIAVVADLSVMAKAPMNLKLAGTGDILCKASSLAEWKLASEEHGESFSQAAFNIAKSALDEVIRDASLEALVRAEIDAGEAMCMAGSSRPCSGTEHSISHAMDRRNQSLHGLQVIFATPLCLHYLDETGYSLYSTDHIRSVMANRGIPMTLDDMSLTLETYLDDIHHGLQIMKNRERYSVLANVDDASLTKTIERFY